MLNACSAGIAKSCVQKLFGAALCAEQFFVVFVTHFYTLFKLLFIVKHNADFLFFVQTFVFARDIAAAILLVKVSYYM
jgi:hypothetical protein